MTRSREMEAKFKEIETYNADLMEIHDEYYDQLESEGEINIMKYPNIVDYRTDLKLLINEPTIKEFLCNLAKFIKEKL